MSGFNFVNFTTDVKIDNEKILLMNTALKIYDITINPEYFSSVFKHIMGITPMNTRI